MKSFLRELVFWMCVVSGPLFLSSCAGKATPVPDAGTVLKPEAENPQDAPLRPDLLSEVALDVPQRVGVAELGRNRGLKHSRSLFGAPAVSGS